MKGPGSLKWNVNSPPKNTVGYAIQEMLSLSYCAGTFDTCIKKKAQVII